MKLLLAGLLTLFLPCLCLAQTPTSYELRVYAKGGVSPQVVTPLPATAYVCNQAPPTVINIVNPTDVVWDDPANAGKVCKYVDGPTGPIVSRPIGDYEGALVAINSAGTGPESSHAPFSRALLVPPAPTGLKVTR